MLHAKPPSTAAAARCCLLAHLRLPACSPPAAAIRQHRWSRLQRPLRRSAIPLRLLPLLHQRFAHRCSALPIGTAIIHSLVSSFYICASSYLNCLSFSPIMLRASSLESGPVGSL